MSNQYDAGNKWYIGDVSPRSCSAPVSLLRDYKQEDVAAHRADEKAVSARLLRRCNNGRKCEYPR